MSITDELREYVNQKPVPTGSRALMEVRDEYNAIADRIDEAHQREMDEARDVALALANHRVTLPYDANGVPINLGDEVYNVDDKPEAHFTVEFLTLDEDGWTVMGEMTEKPSNLRHWEAPTVEDVLQECCHKYHSLLIDDMNDAINRVERDYIAPSVIIDEYAERIREAVQDEEDK